MWQSSPVADATALVYAMVSRSIRSDETAPRSTTKPRSRSSEAASFESLLRVAKLLNQSDISSEQSNYYLSDARLISIPSGALSLKADNNADGDD